MPRSVPSELFEPQAHLLHKVRVIRKMLINNEKGWRWKRDLEHGCACNFAYRPTIAVCACNSARAKPDGKQWKENVGA